MGIKLLISNLIIFLLFCGCGKYQEENIKKIINHNETESFSEACSEEDTQDNTQVDLKNNTQDDVKSNTDKMPTDYYTKEEGQIWLNKLIDMGYSVSSEKFEDIDININKNIVIKYPKITGFKDKQLETKINDVIQNSAMEEYYKFMNNDFLDDCEYIEWPVEYTIVYFNNDLISIVSEGHTKYCISNEHYNGAVFGTNITYATNINMKTGERLSTDDLFTEEFKNKIAHKYLKGIDIDTRNADEDTVNETYAIWREYFYPSNNNFYFCRNGFVIIIYWGSYHRYIIYYEDLKDCIKSENPIWESFLE